MTDEERLAAIRNTICGFSHYLVDEYIDHLRCAWKQSDAKRAKEMAAINREMDELIRRELGLSA